jgi:hypothetical protein
MSNKTDVTVLILRFIFGAILGALLTLLMLMTDIWLGDPKVTNLVLILGAAITIILGISATIWGDKCLVGVVKLFKIFKYFP